MSMHFFKKLRPLCLRHREQLCKPEREYSRNVVVTGIGIVSPLGCGTQRVWERLIQGESGITKVIGKGYEGISSKVVGCVPENELDKKHIDKNKTLATSYAFAAADEALRDANWKPQTLEDQCNTGVSVGAVGMIKLDYIYDAGVNLATRGPRSVSPYFILKTLFNVPAGELAIRHKLKGPNHSAFTACATGTHAIGDAMRFIAHGDCDVMVAGAADACISPFVFGSFSQIRALSKNFNDTPEKSSRPFDTDRDGFVIGEGGAILVLEEENHARKRGARAYARVSGYGLSGDAANIVAPHADGEGAKRAMATTIRNSGYQIKDISYINAHATSTPQGDRAEATAITSLFGDRVENLAVSSTKGAVGHLLGSAGAIEAAFTVLACYRGLLPPTINLENQDTGIKLDCIPNEARKWTTKGPRVALSNSFGFGGTNASLCFSSI